MNERNTQPATPKRPQENSYVLSLNGRWEQAQGAPQHRLGPLSIYTPPEGLNHLMALAIGQRYHLIAYGSLYLDISSSFDLKENTQLLLDLLETYGLKAGLTHLQGGMYSLYIWDQEEQTLTLSNDLLGLQPQYLVNDGRVLLFSNNVFNFANRPLEESALVEFLKFGYLPVSHSLFEGVQRSPALHQGHWDAKTERLQWTPTDFSYPDANTPAPQRDTLLHDWSTALSRYAARLKPHAISLGLSGGYDSRLLGALSQDMQVSALHFGHPRNGETRLAKQVADHLGFPLEVHSFHGDALAELDSHLGSRLDLLTSLENAHIHQLAQAVAYQGQDVYLDGYLGGAILGDAYSKASGTPFQRLRQLIFGADFSSTKSDVSTTAQWLYDHDKQALSDEALGSILDDVSREKMMAGLERLVAEQEPQCAFQSDVKERMGLLTRGRRLIANGPLAIQSKLPVLLPFMDNDILRLSINTPKAWRFGHGFYNELWRMLAPSLANIRKAGTFGSAQNAPISYRLKGVAFKLWQALKARLPISFQPEENYFNVADYLRTPGGSALWSRVWSTTPQYIPVAFHETVKSQLNKAGEPALLSLRYLTLFLSLETLNDPTN